MDKYRTHNVLKKGEELWKVASATESILSKVRQGKVRVFSDSVLCRRNGAMSEASGKLTIRSTMGQPLRKEEIFNSSIAQTVEKLPCSHWRCPQRDAIGNGSTPETCVHGITFMSMMNELAVSFTVHQGDEVNVHNSTVVRDYAGRFRPGKRLFVGKV